MRFTTDDKHLIIWMGVKKLCKKCLLKMFLTDEVFMGWRHWLKYQCEIFNFFDLCSGVGIVWLTTTWTWVSDATAVTLSVKCFNPLKLHPLSGNIFRKWFASYFLFVHEHLIICDLKHWILLLWRHFYWCPVYIAASKEYLRIHIIIWFRT